MVDNQKGLKHLMNADQNPLETVFCQMTKICYQNSVSSCFLSILLTTWYFSLPPIECGRAFGY